MENANLFLENTLLLMAVLLFLAVLPRALRHILLQKERTALDKVVERFEEEELKAAAEGKSAEKDTRQDEPVSPKDGSLAYLMGDIPTSQTPEDRGIPPFPEPEEEEGEQIKIVKEGVPISHNEATAPAPNKKVKLIKQGFSIAPDVNKVSSKKTISEPLKEKKSIPQAKDQKSKGDEDFHKLPVSNQESEESDGNWVEAEIPGLVMEPPPATERPESIPTFKASPKVKPQSEAEKPPKSPRKENQGTEVKNIAPESDEKKDSKPKKHVKIDTDSPKSVIEISESKPKAVEIKAPVVSHKNIAKKEAEQKKAKAPSSKAGKTQKTKTEVTAVPPQKEEIKASPEKAKPKPFFLNLEYLDQEDLETEHPVSHEQLPDDMVDVVIARLNALQVDLESQLISKPGELMPRENPVNGNMRKDRNQDSLPMLEGTIKESSDKKEVSLNELDSFLFTATQRKNRE
jgi:hypothetical protein